MNVKVIKLFELEYPNALLNIITQRNLNSKYIKVGIKIQALSLLDECLQSSFRLNDIKRKDILKRLISHKRNEKRLKVKSELKRVIKKYPLNRNDGGEVNRIRFYLANFN